MIRCLFILVPIISGFCSLFSQDGYPRQHHIDVTHYHFTLSLNDTTDIIEGSAEIQLLFVSQADKLVLDLKGGNDNATGMEVLHVAIKGYAFSHSHIDDKLNIHFDQRVNEGSNLSVHIQYRGTPEDGLIISKNKYGDRTFFGDNWPNRARNWIPCIDHPYDKAGVTFSVFAPQHYMVIANGSLVEESFLMDGNKLTVWKEFTPIPTKVMVIGVATFARQIAGNVECIPVESWVYPQNKEEGFYDYAMALDVLPFFIDNVGPYSYTKLANVQSKTRYGGMENAGNIFYFENSVTGKRTIESLIAHEIAHQWFGNSATEDDWLHVWLSEGFATYFTELYLEHTYGVEKLMEGMEKTRQTVLRYHKANPMPVVRKEVKDYNELLNPNSYQKGAWVLHMLRREMGDQNFWLSMREYYQVYQNKNALTDDFLKICEKVSGKDLTWFFDQWLYTAGHPVLQIQESYEEGVVKIEIQQMQDKLFSFPLDIEFTDSSGQNHRMKKSISERNTVLQYALDHSPVSVNLDPDVRLLFELGE